MIGAVEAIKAAVVLLVGAIVGWLAASLYADVVSLPAAREAGRVEERGVWQRLQDDARREAEAKQREAQVRIDQVERDYHQRDQARQADMAELEAALDAERNDATPIPTPSPGASCACRPAVSRSVSERLQNLGRAATPRGGSAGAPASLR